MGRDTTASYIRRVRRRFRQHRDEAGAQVVDTLGLLPPGNGVVGVLQDVFSQVEVPHIPNARALI